MLGEFYGSRDALGGVLWPLGSMPAQHAVANDSDLGVINCKASPYSAVGDGVSDDTAAIQAALDAAELNPSLWVYLPPGSFLTNGVILRGTGVKLFGPGTLKRKASATAKATLRLLDAERCEVDGISVDGSPELAVGGSDTGTGIQIESTSSYNLIRNTFVSGTRLVSGGGRGYNTIGKFNSWINPRAYDCDRSAFSTANPSDGTTLINPMFYSIGLTNGSTTGVRGISVEGNLRIYGGFVDQSAVTFDPSVLGHTALLCDPDGDVIDYISIHGTTFKTGGDWDANNQAVKFAKCRSIHVSDVRLEHTGTGGKSMRVAELCEDVVFQNILADGQFFKENNLEAGHIPDRLVIDNCSFQLNANQRQAYALEELNFKNIEITRSVLHGNRGIKTTIADADLVRCVIDDVDWYGYSDGVSPTSNIFLFPNDAEMLRQSGKYVLLNLRMNQMGAGLSYSSSNPSRRELLGTIDRTGRNYESAAAPVDASNTWALRDRVFSTATPAAGQPDFWLCKVAGVGGTAGQWQAHNL